MFQAKEQDMSSETDLNETEINDLSVIKILTEAWRIMHGQNENLDREIEQNNLDRII